MTTIDFKVQHLWEVFIGIVLLSALSLHCHTHPWLS